MPNNQVAKIYELLTGFDTALLITQAHHQPLRARPMALARVEADCRLWFFTGRDSAKVHEIQDNQEVLIACQDEHSRYISLSGTAELVANRTQVRELWKESYRTWFPKGVEDPDLLLIAVQPKEAEYWDSHGFKGVRYLFEAAKAYATGTRPHIQEGEQHGKVVME
jgi:general stress protein 26